MANRFWVGGTASWDGTAGTKWALTDGGAGGQAVPTTSDDVFFTALSGVVTVTVASGNFGCANLDFTGFTGTFAGATSLQVAGSFTAVLAMTYTHSTSLLFQATTSGKTITTNGKSLTSTFDFNGVGGVWTLQDNLTTSRAFQITNGTVDLNAKNLSCQNINCATATVNATLTASGSTITHTAANPFTVTAAMTLTVNTLTTWNLGTTVNFTGAGKSFNDVTLSPGGTISGANTFRNLTISAGSSTTTFDNNNVVTGTFTVTGTSASARMFLVSDTIGTARTITAAAVVVTDVDFQDITGAGAASPFTGTRLGDCKGNSGITFTGAANKFYVGNTANWNAVVWATVTGGAAAANNYPLPQDTCVLDANSFNANGQSVTINSSFRIGTITCSGTDQTYSIVTSAAWTLFGDLTLDANITSLSAAGDTMTCSGRTTQTLTRAGGNIGNGPVITVDSLGGTVKFADSWTIAASRGITLTRGTLNLNAQAISAGTFSSSSTNTRSITSGGATLTLTGNAATILIAATLTGFTLNDALQIDSTYSGAAGTRVFQWGSTGGTEATAASLKLSAGTDTVQLGGSMQLKNVDFTGFGGTWSNNAMTIYGNLILSLTMTLPSGASSFTFASTSGTKTITSSTKTMDFPVVFNGVGGTWQLVDAMTVGSTRTTTLTNGTLDINGLTLSTGLFASSNSNVRTIKSTAASGKIITTATTVSTVFNCSTSTNLTVTRNSWTIEIGGNTTNVRTFAGGGVMWPTVTFTNTTANGELDFTGSNTFSSLAVSTAPQSIKFTAATTTTIENGFPSGTAGNLVTIGSITAANHNLAASGSTDISCGYLSISRSQATVANTWYAGTTSTDGGNNTGWIFTAAPAFNGTNVGFMTPRFL